MGEASVRTTSGTCTDALDPSVCGLGKGASGMRGWGTPGKGDPREIYDLAGDPREISLTPGKFSDLWETRNLTPDLVSLEYRITFGATVQFLTILLPFLRYSARLQIHSNSELLHSIECLS